MSRIYITQQNERWDTISYKLYGRPDLYHRIQDANPDLPPELRFTPILPQGIKLFIPDISQDEITHFEAPPWRK